MPKGCQGVLKSENKSSSGSTPRHRFHCPDLGAAGDLVALPPEQGRHATKVLRLGEGDEVELFDGQGLVGRGTIVAARRDEVSVRTGAVVRVEPPRPTLDLAVALPKGPRVEDMVNQIVQVGVDRLVPLRAARATVEPRDTRLERLRRVALDAARQSRRAWLMAIDEPASLAQVIAGGHDLRLLAAPGAAALEPGRITAAQRVLVLVGPEGGWTEDELGAARHGGCLAWRLGPHVMRIETAAVAAAAIVRHAVS